MINGTKVDEYNPKPNDISSISSLIEYELNEKKNSQNNFDKYMLNTFHTYCNNKKTIVFDMTWMEEDKTSVWCCFEDLPKLLLHLVIVMEKKGEINNNSLLKDIVFKLFNNLETIYINNCGFSPFSLTKLLLLWNSLQSNVKITIQAEHLE
eukprot:1333_1